ncbi:family 65 glycosyl hydrolase domain-containing protein [Fodinibius halophilus]|uniref:Glycoside hydrolase family 65 protein n=1 Tax=Fodinibius halophilus TaxID=1736908 RepID=A0A6M1T9J8_9BACT|nr:family 65 glycosyl hydrolase domain-containing protein [Fodinibius halophilus]NGP87032.1 glycoside hydrolase family 65 protein [Fodinibius halophilus]
MNQYLEVDKWNIIEDGFNPEQQRSSESIFSLGNGHMGQRANFEESYSGDSLQGSYIGGIYYPDKTKVGWWKNGYPEYFAKVLNSVNWIGIDIAINGAPLDLFKCGVSAFKRVLNMKKGYLKRLFVAELPSGDKVEVEVTRFISMARKEIGAIEYNIKSLNFDGDITFKPYVNGDVRNEDANYDEHFWSEVEQGSFEEGGYVTTRTKKLDFHVTASMTNQLQQNGNDITEDADTEVESMQVSEEYTVPVSQGDEVSLHKIAVVASSLNHSTAQLKPHVKSLTKDAAAIGFATLLYEHTQRWAEIWDGSDVLIEGDDKAQQGIRFNIFQLYQTYTGEDERLNIGPKGFTGEKYGGCTYWDTEAYCLPFYLNTAPNKVARNLLLYRYQQLPEAIENAEKLGFENGAALYPMVTMNGEECHNEWEITFEEVHRNGAMAYAIHNYIQHTGDESYLSEAGLEVLIAISRFWSQRFNYSEKRDKFVMLGVTGPNEYENNINNNWYTSYIGCWTMKYTLESIEKVRSNNSERYSDIQDKIGFSEDETAQWKEIMDNVHLPEDKKRGIFLQQDNYLDKEQRTVEDLNENERPLNQHWSWDRILRSCFIKQGDVVQGLYFFEDHFDEEMLRRNFDFYEPRTVHESSLSPCIHAIMASKLGYSDRAYEFYLRTARLDLDDYNEEVHQGLHITSMAGTWMAIVEGFAGKRAKDGELYFAPTLPDEWSAYSFKILYKGRRLKIRVEAEEVQITCEDGETVQCYVYDEQYQITADEPLKVSRKKAVA